MEFTMVIPDDLAEQRRPLLCALCGKFIAGAYEYWLESNAEFWIWQSLDGQWRFRNKTCTL